MTPKQFFDDTIGKKIDTDNYPRSNPYQCWDYFDYFCRIIGFKGSRHCSSTGYVGDLWFMRNDSGYNYSTDFYFITDPKDFKTGDWIFWKRHVAMYYNGMEVGQNQPAPYVTEKAMNWEGILGAMRWKHWQTIEIPYGYSEIKIEDRKYVLQRMRKDDHIAVLAVGLNKTARFADFTADDISPLAMISGANFFQNDPDNPAGQAYGMTFGDLSSPLNNVYQSLPNQDSTLFYNLEKGEFGDCTDYAVDPNDNVFSPALVYPNSKGNWEYARMVGTKHINLESIYTFLLRMSDGYCIGIALQISTPKQIAEDMSSSDIINISFLDGGGSAQACFKLNGEMKYARVTDREVPSVICIYTKPVVPDKPEYEASIGKVVCTYPMYIRSRIIDGDPLVTVKDECELLGFLDGIQADGYQWIRTRKGQYEGYSQFDSNVYWIQINGGQKDG